MLLLIPITAAYALYSMLTMTMYPPPVRGGYALADAVNALHVAVETILETVVIKVSLLVDAVHFPAFSIILSTSSAVGLWSVTA